MTAPVGRNTPGDRLVRRLGRWTATALGLPIRLYRYAISPLLPPSCRFYPSCSEYALAAITSHGPLTGGWLAARRLCRCHPWNRGGIDPVPLVVGRRLRDAETRGAGPGSAPSSSYPAKME